MRLGRIYGLAPERAPSFLSSSDVHPTAMEGDVDGLILCEAKLDGPVGAVLAAKEGSFLLASVDGPEGMASGGEVANESAIKSGDSLASNAVGAPDGAF